VGLQRMPRCVQRYRQKRRGMDAALPLHRRGFVQIMR